MRWWKQFREDFDRPGFQLGIEKFGTSFVHDVGRVWQTLCVEDGPGIRKVELSDAMVCVLARQFRVTSQEAIERLEFMAQVALIDLTGTDTGKNRTLFSSELKNRRDEWTARNSKKRGGKAKSDTRESLGTRAGVTPEQRQRSKAEAKAEAKLTTNSLCSHGAKNVWQFTGIKPENLPHKFRGRDFTDFVAETFASYRAASHDANDGACLCSPVDFLDQLRNALKAAAKRYPASFLAQQVRMEKLERERCALLP